MCRECVSVCVCLRERERQCVCVCVCERERERERESLLPPSLYASLFLSALPRSISPPRSLASLPFLLYTFLLSSLSPPFRLLLLLPPSPFLPLYPLLSLSLAVHHFWRWMSPRLKLRRLCPWLAAIHKLAIKKREKRKKGTKERKGGEKRVGGWVGWRG